MQSERSSDYQDITSKYSMMDSQRDLKEQFSI